MLARCLLDHILRRQFHSAVYSNFNQKSTQKGLGSLEEDRGHRGCPTAGSGPDLIKPEPPTHKINIMVEALGWSLNGMRTAYVLETRRFHDDSLGPLI
jgi:hypothetical protein